MRHLLTLFDLSETEIHEYLLRAKELKRAFEEGVRDERHARRVLALLFEKPSLRTRVSFESAMTHLGGSTLYLGNDVGWGQREPVADFATVLGNYVDCVVCRAFAHSSVEELASYSSAPVINGLTDRYHPCQALADLFTIDEHFGSLANRVLAYVGDANNVARSLAIGCLKLGVEFRIASPENYQFDAEFREALSEHFSHPAIIESTDPREVVAKADVVYTDVWASMGQEDEQAERARAFRHYQVTADLMRLASPDAVFMHCLPAHRGEEVAAEVIDSPQSIVFLQAENRMHVQKGILDCLLTQTAARAESS